MRFWSVKFGPRAIQLAILWLAGAAAFIWNGWNWAYPVLMCAIGGFLTVTAEVIARKQELRLREADDAERLWLACLAAQRLGLPSSQILPLPEDI